MSEEKSTEELLEHTAAKLEGAGNFLVGLQLDPSIPKHAKDAMAQKSGAIFDFLSDNF